LATRDCGLISRNTTLCEYAEQYWNWEQSHHIRTVLAENPAGLSKEYITYNHNYIIKHAKPFFKNKPIRDVTTRDIEQYRIHLRSKPDEYASSTIIKIMYAVIGPIREAYRLGDLPYDPTKGTFSFRHTRIEKKRGCFHEKEIKALLALDWGDHRYKTAFKLAALCGMRLGEIKALQRIDVCDGHLIVRHSWSNSTGLKGTKNGKERIAPLAYNLLEDLNKLDRTCFTMGDLLFHGKDRMKPLSSRAIEQALYSAMEQIGISKEERIKRNLVFHSLRHFANTYLLQSMIPENVRLIMGHSSQAMTERYSHSLEETLKQGRKAQLQFSKPQYA
jgi:integrase